MPYRFDHETLEVYQVALDVARTVRGFKAPRGYADLVDQARRASQSIVLNIAEGRARHGKARTNHYSIACGGAAELCAVFDLLPQEEAEALQEKLRRVGLMLTRLGA